jgi:hypothetical protein
MIALPFHATQPRPLLRRGLGFACSLATPLKRSAWFLVRPEWSMLALEESLSLKSAAAAALTAHSRAAVSAKQAASGWRTPLRRLTLPWVLQHAVLHLTVPPGAAAMPKCGRAVWLRHVDLRRAAPAPSQQRRAAAQAASAVRSSGAGPLRGAAGCCVAEAPLAALLPDRSSACSASQLSAETAAAR